MTEIAGNDAREKQKIIKKSKNNQSEHELTQRKQKKLVDLCYFFCKIPCVSGGNDGII